MARVTYNGGHVAVEVASPDGGFVVVKRGETVEVDDATADGLCEQEQWTRADEPVSKGKGDK